MITKPNSFLDTFFEELEYLMEIKSWEDAQLLAEHLSEYIHLMDQEMLDKYYEWSYNIDIELEYE